MAQPIKQTPTAPPHVIVPPQPGQTYFGVVHADSGREIVRCVDAASAAVEQARLNKLG